MDDQKLMGGGGGGECGRQEGEGEAVGGGVRELNGGGGATG